LKFMSGHSKWHSIRHKKGAADAARGKVFTRLTKLITIAARDGGGDIDMNPSLRLAVENAKKENMPNANIDRAIKKGTGEDKSAAQFFEITYEGYGPEGVAVLVETLTDNKNRTVSSVRSLFSKNGGNLGESGSVSFLFSKKGVLTLANSTEDLELFVIESGAEDVQQEENGNLEVITNVKNFFSLKKKLEEIGAEIISAEMNYIPGNTVRITDESAAQKVVRLIQALDDDEDVSNVATNVDIPHEIMEKLMD
jgi:YebC/PmpR family DNA-binding regulatory protein